MDVLGYRGWCRRCKHSESQEKDILQNAESPLHKHKVNSIICAPCLTEDSTKKEAVIEPVGLEHS